MANKKTEFCCKIDKKQMLFGKMNIIYHAS